MSQTPAQLADRNRQTPFSDDECLVRAMYSPMHIDLKKKSLQRALVYRKPKPESGNRVELSVTRLRLTDPSFCRQCAIKHTPDKQAYYGLAAISVSSFKQYFRTFDLKFEATPIYQLEGSQQHNTNYNPHHADVSYVVTPALSTGTIEKNSVSEYIEKMIKAGYPGSFETVPRAIFIFEDLSPAGNSWSGQALHCAVN